jgi:8-oxo-dGTP diphosphatase
MKANKKENNMSEKKTKEELENEKFQQYYDFIIKVLSIAKIGLVFSKDPYALDNYQELEKLSMTELENFEHLKFDKPDLFTREIYPTPNVSVRTCVFNDKGQILLVREHPEERYSIPGGWCDLYDAPSEAAKNECEQEAGAKIKNMHLIGILNRTPFKVFPAGTPLAKSVPEYMVIFRADLDGTLAGHTYETDDVNFFDIKNLPPLSKKVTEGEVLKVIDAAYNNKIIFD